MKFLIKHIVIGLINIFGGLVVYEKYFEEPTSNTSSDQNTVEVLADTASIDEQSIFEFDTIQFEDRLKGWTDKIYFETNKSTLKPESWDALNNIADMLIEYPNIDFIIEGHTDNIGLEDFNLNLSKERAKTVYDFLISAGVSDDRIIEYNGFGETQPIASNGTEMGRRQNRRVRIKPNW